VQNGPMTLMNAAARTNDPGPWLMLPARLFLFAAVQALFAVALGSWDASIAFWPIAATLANIATIALLVALFAREGRSFWRLFAVDTALLRQDLPILALVVLISGVLAYFPNIWLADWLFGSPDGALQLLLRPLPLWVAALTIAFPLTIVFAELPTYFAYAVPRIETQIGSRWLAVLLGSTFLAVQHVTLPLIFDARFMLWRTLMFLPFAVFLGVVLHWRPRCYPIWSSFTACSTCPWLR
jgi:hypothetical protein